LQSVFISFELGFAFFLTAALENMKIVIELLLFSLYVALGFGDNFESARVLDDPPPRNYSQSFVEKFYMKRQLMEAQKEDHHHLNWRSLEEVNGLKNSEVIVFILSSDNQGGRFLWERCEVLKLLLFCLLFQ
jgi:hypothetical protein